MPFTYEKIIRVKAAKRLQAARADSWATSVEADSAEDGDWALNTNALGQGELVSAAQRLVAVQVVPTAYTDQEGARDLQRVYKEFLKRRRRIGNDKRGFAFWWVGQGENTLACMHRDTRRVVGFVGLRIHTETLELNGQDVKCRAISSVYLSPEFRGRGLILGMYQYLVSQFNLVSDDVCTPGGLSIWKQLKRAGHKVEVIDDRTMITPPIKTPSTDWKSLYTRLLIRRNQ